MKQKINKQRGFSLLEVLVAFSIFALSLGVIFQIYSKGTQSAILSDEYARAVIIAQSRLASIGLDETATIGEFSDTEGKFQWVTRINPIETDFDLETKFRIVKCDVEVEVQWDSFGKKRAITLNSIKLIPDA